MTDDADVVEPFQRVVDYFAEIADCLGSIQGALRHRQQPQDVHFHLALKACRDGASHVERLRSALSAAVNAEREACAVVAETFTDVDNDGGWDICRDLIAAAIRNRSTP